MNIYEYEYISKHWTSSLWAWIEKKQYIKSPQTPAVCEGIYNPVYQMKASIQTEAQVFLWGGRHPYSEL